ncbi:MAG: 2-amino-4-hydroxy-6-hydroxymethyldihydropteridine diphosphokinase [Bryobacteraceae bacterium]
MKTVYLSLGSNLGDREQMIQRAVGRIHAPDLAVKLVSSIYETEPIGPKHQGWFLNAVAEVETDLFPLQLLSRLQKVELELGRKRLASQGPRSIDIDILLYGGFVIRSARLVVPHPRMHERRFVLEPLAELAPELRHPGLRSTIRELLSKVLNQSSRKLP